MSQERMIPTKPSMAIARVELDWAVALGSPAEVRYWKPPEINIKIKARPAM